MDNIEMSIWTSIGLSNVLKSINERVYDAIRNQGKHVKVSIDSETVAEFIRVEDRIVAVIDGNEVARYPA